MATILDRAEKEYLWDHWSSVGQHWSRLSHEKILGLEDGFVVERGLKFSVMFPTCLAGCCVYYCFYSSQIWFPFQRGGNWSSKMLSNLAKVVKLTKWRGQESSATQVSVALSVESGWICGEWRTAKVSLAFLQDACKVQRTPARAVRAPQSSAWGLMVTWFTGAWWRHTHLLDWLENYRTVSLMPFLPSVGYIC